MTNKGSLTKSKASAEDIRREIFRRIRSCDKTDCQESPVPMPRYADPVENYGCNWTFDVLPGIIPGCEELVISITKEVMRDYDLLE